MTRDEIREKLLADTLARHGGDTTSADFYTPLIDFALDAYYSNKDGGRAITTSAETLLVTLRDGKRDGGWNYEKRTEFAGAVKQVFYLYYWLRQIQDLMEGNAVENSRTE